MPVAARQALDLGIARAQARKPDILGKVRKGRVSEHGRVPDQLMADVWLWRVQRLAVMPDVLRGKKYAKRQRIQKIPGAEQPGHGPQAEACD